MEFLKKIGSILKSKYDDAFSEQSVGKAKRSTPKSIPQSINSKSTTTSTPQTQPQPKKSPIPVDQPQKKEPETPVDTEQYIEFETEIGRNPFNKVNTMQLQSDGTVDVFTDFVNPKLRTVRTGSPRLSEEERKEGSNIIESIAILKQMRGYSDDYLRIKTGKEFTGEVIEKSIKKYEQKLSDFNKKHNSNYNLDMSFSTLQSIGKVYDDKTIANTNLKLNDSGNWLTKMLGVQQIDSTNIDPDLGEAFVNTIANQGEVAGMVRSPDTWLGKREGKIRSFFSGDEAPTAEKALEHNQKVLSLYIEYYAKGPTPERKVVLANEFKDLTGMDIQRGYKISKRFGNFRAILDHAQGILTVSEDYLETFKGKHNSEEQNKLADLYLKSKGLATEDLTIDQQRKFSDSQQERFDTSDAILSWMNFYETQDDEYKAIHAAHFELAKQKYAQMRLFHYQIALGKTAEEANQYVIDNLGGSPFEVVDPDEFSVVKNFGTNDTFNYFETMHTFDRFSRDLNPIGLIASAKSLARNQIDHSVAAINVLSAHLENFVFGGDESTDFALQINSSALNINRDVGALKWFRNYVSSAAGDILGNILVDRRVAGGISKLSKLGSAGTKIVRTAEQVSKTNRLANFFGMRRLTAYDEIGTFATNAEKARFLAKHHVFGALEDFIQSLSVDEFLNMERSSVDNWIDIGSWPIMTRHFKNLDIEQLGKELTREAYIKLGKSFYSELPKHIKDKYSFLQDMSDADYYEYGTEMSRSLLKRMANIDLEDPKLQEILAKEKGSQIVASKIALGREEMIKQSMAKSPKHRHNVTLDENGRIQWNFPAEGNKKDFLNKMNDDYKNMNSDTTNIVTSVRNMIQANDYQMLKNNPKYISKFYEVSPSGKLVRDAEGKPIPKKISKQSLDRLAEELFDSTMESLGLGRVSKKETVATKGSSYTISYKPALNFPGLKQISDAWSLSRSKAYLRKNWEAKVLIQNTVRQSGQTEPFYHFVKKYYPQYMDGTRLDLSNISRKELDKLLTEYAEIGVGHRYREFLMESARNFDIIADETQLYFTKLSYKDITERYAKRFFGMTYETWSAIMDHPHLDAFQKERLLRMYQPVEYKRGNNFLAWRTFSFTKWGSSNAEIMAQLGQRGSARIMYYGSHHAQDVRASNVNTDLDKIKAKKGDRPIDTYHYKMREEDGVVIYSFRKDLEDMEDMIPDVEISFKDGVMMNAKYDHPDKYSGVAFKFTKHTDVDDISYDHFSGNTFKDFSYEATIASTPSSTTPSSTTPSSTTPSTTQPATQQQSRRKYSVSHLMRLSDAISKGLVTNTMIKKVFGDGVSLPQDLIDVINDLHNLGYNKNQALGMVMDYAMNLSFSSNINGTMTIGINNITKNVLSIVENILHQPKYIVINDALYYMDFDELGNRKLYSSHNKETVVGEIKIDNDVTIKTGFKEDPVYKISVSNKDATMQQAIDLDYVTTKQTSGVRFETKDIKKDFFKITGYDVPVHFTNDMARRNLSHFVGELLSHKYSRYFKVEKVTADNISLLKQKLNTMSAYVVSRNADESYHSLVAEFIDGYFDPNNQSKFLEYINKTLQFITKGFSSPTIYDMIDAYIYTKSGANIVDPDFKINSRRRRILSKLLGTDEVLSYSPDRVNALMNILPKLDVSSEQSILDSIRKDPEGFMKFLEEAYEILHQSNALAIAIDDVRKTVNDIVEKAEENIARYADKEEMKDRFWYINDKKLLADKEEQFKQGLNKTIDFLYNNVTDNSTLRAQKIHSLEWVRKIRDNVLAHEEVKEMIPKSMDERIWVSEGYVNDMIYNSPLFKNATVERVDVNGNPIITLRYGKSDLDTINRMATRIADENVSGAYVNDLKLIALGSKNGEFDPTALGHEYFHFITNTTQDIERIREVNRLTYEKYADAVEEYAKTHGYDYDLFLKTVPEVAGMNQREIDDFFREWKTEEFLAQKFGEWVARKWVPEDKTLLSYFQELLKKIVNIFEFKPATDLFEDIYNGVIVPGASTKKSVDITDPLIQYQKFIDNSRIIDWGNTEESIIRNLKNIPENYLRKILLTRSYLGYGSLFFPQTARLLEKATHQTDDIAKSIVIDKAMGNQHLEKISGPLTLLSKQEGATAELYRDLNGNTITLKNKKINQDGVQLEYSYFDFKSGEITPLYTQNINKSVFNSSSSIKKYFSKILYEDTKDSLYLNLSNLASVGKFNDDFFLKELRDTVYRELDTYNLGLGDVNSNVVSNLSQQEIDLANLAWKVHDLNKIIPHGIGKAPVQEVLYLWKKERAKDLIRQITQLNSPNLSVDILKPRNKSTYSVVFSLNAGDDSTKLLAYHMRFNDLELAEFASQIKTVREEPKISTWVFNWLSGKRPGPGVADEETSYIDELLKRAQLPDEKIQFARLKGDLNNVALVKNTSPERFALAISRGKFTPAAMGIKAKDNLGSTQYGTVMVRIAPSETTLNEAIGGYGDIGSPSIEDFGLQQWLDNTSVEEKMDVLTRKVLGIPYSVVASYIEKGDLRGLLRLPEVNNVKKWKGYYDVARKLLNDEMDIELYQYLRYTIDHPVYMDGIYTNKKYPWLTNLFDNTDVVLSDEINVDVLLKNYDDYPEDVKEALHLFNEELPNGKRMGYEPDTNNFTVNQIVEDLYPIYSGEAPMKELNGRDLYFIKNAIENSRWITDIDSIHQALVDNPKTLKEDFGMTKESLKKSVENLFFNYSRYSAYFELFTKSVDFRDVAEVYISAMDLEELTSHLPELQLAEANVMRDQLSKILTERFGQEVRVLSRKDIDNIQMGIDIKPERSPLIEDQFKVSYSRYKKNPKKEIKKMDLPYTKSFLENDDTTTFFHIGNSKSLEVFESFSQDKIDGRSIGYDPKTKKQSLRQLSEDLSTLYSDPNYKIKPRDLELLEFMRGETEYSNLERVFLAELFHQDKLPAFKELKESTSKDVFAEIINHDPSYLSRFLLRKQEIPNAVKKTYYGAKSIVFKGKYAVIVPHQTKALIDDVVTQQKEILDDFGGKVTIMRNGVAEEVKMTAADYEATESRLGITQSLYRVNADRRKMLEKEFEYYLQKKEDALSDTYKGRDRNQFKFNSEKWVKEANALLDNIPTSTTNKMIEKKIRADLDAIKKIAEDKLSMLDEFDTFRITSNSLLDKMEAIEDVFSKNPKAKDLLDVNKVKAKTVSKVLDPEIVYPPLTEIKRKLISKNIPLDGFQLASGLSHTSNPKYVNRPAFRAEVDALNRNGGQFKYTTLAPSAVTDQVKAMMDRLDYVAVWGWNDTVYNGMKEYLTETHDLIFERAKGNVAYYKRKSDVVKINGESVELTAPKRYIYNETELPNADEMADFATEVGKELDFIGGINCEING